MTDLQHSIPDAPQPLNTSRDAPRRALPAEYLHDLRTPLNHIIGYSEMLNEQAQREGHAGFVDDLQKICVAGRQLLDLLNSGAPAQIPREYSITPVSSVPSTHTITALHAAQFPPATAPVVPGTAPAVILVVDDVEANRDILSRRLQRQGYGVVTAENGRMAMEVVRAQAFDLVLLDIMMPEMDGYAVLQELKTDNNLRHIPVIMISALNELESVVRCIEMGAEDYLCKPFEPTLLKARIGACLEIKRARDRETQMFAHLQQNYKRLQELEKLRDDLMNMIVHDLRTPLTSVIAGMQMLEGLGTLNDVQRQVVGIALNGGQTLQGMINDLLDVEKMESGSLLLDYSVLNVAALVESALTQVASLGAMENLTLIQEVAPELPALRADESKLRRILVNLLGNAIKFTPRGGTVTVEARSDETLQTIVFSVRDTGEGIPSEAFEHIFEKFGQVESRASGRTMSTGLGLTFCKLAVEAHGGHITVESVPEQGSTFRFALPLQQTPN